MIEFKGSHFEREVILWGVRWYVAYPMSYRQLEEMMQDRAWFKIGDFWVTRTRQDGRVLKPDLDR
jgi:hypothetical protein